jgi:hypothetical protein
MVVVFFRSEDEISDEIDDDDMVFCLNLCD